MTTSEVQRQPPKQPKYPGVFRLPRREMAICCVVFAITGTSSSRLVTPLLRLLLDSTALSWTGIPSTGSLFAGPNDFRLLYLLCMTPTYTLLLLLVGTLCGRRDFFSHFAVKMWTRMLPAPALGAMKRALGVEQ
jgi:hypothetical protein